MSYDRHINFNVCDICSRSSKYAKLFSYRKFAHGAEYGPTFHLCFKCVQSGFYWCFTCQQIHTSTQGCEQAVWLNTPFSQDEESPTG